MEMETLYFEWSWQGSRDPSRVCSSVARTNVGRNEVSGRIGTTHCGKNQLFIQKLPRI